ncbi:MAG: hypothetical protein LBQ50_05695 [Planctomycetaceae bacterium]|jgi:hypothetical protein|nr:hypothetical protein [Planctomycetaceae bacterium]
MFPFEIFPFDRAKKKEEAATEFEQAIRLIRPYKDTAINERNHPFVSGGGLTPTRVFFLN